MLESKKWIRLSVPVLAFAIVIASWLVGRNALPASAVAAQLCLVVLMLGALSGWMLGLGKILPLVLARIWPKLDAA